MITKIKTCFQKSLQLGVSSEDSEALSLRKTSITMLPFIIAPAGLIWGLIYFSFGNYQSGIIPMLYVVISFFTLWHFKATKNIFVIQKIQLLIILILPFLLMWSLGGFANGSLVMLWAFFSPVAASVVDKSKRSLCWFYSFIGLVIFSTLIDSWLIENVTNDTPDLAIKIFFLLNIAGSLSGVYFLVRYYIDQNDKHADEKLELKNSALKSNTMQLFDNLSYLQSYKDNIDKNLIVTKTDLEGKITFANENFYKISGYNKEEVIGKTHNIIRHKNNKDALFKDLWMTISDKKSWQGRLQNRAKDGSTYWIDTTISPILNNDDEIVEYIAIRHDITKLMNQQDELTYLLYTDQLTGLKNRNALLKELEEEDEFFLSLINIDRFSQINNLYGEEFGNKVLVEFSLFLASSMNRELNCKLYRLGSDEFVILCQNTNPLDMIDNISTLIRKINEQHMIIEDQEIVLGITVGSSFEENDKLLSTAGMALNIARRESKSLSLYTKDLSLESEYENNIKWIKEIKDAIAEDRITMFFQPIINNVDSSITKYESLIRLIDRDGKIITPYHFLEIAKKAKLYKNLTKIVIKKSFEAFKDNDYEFSINITIEDILNKEINNYIVDTLIEYKISNRVIFEIVESESIEDFEKVEEFITNVKSFGCKISIDDFGTGYSNFEHLMRLQADYIKIDGSIIKEITTNKRSELITSIIVAFAKEMNIQTIGEYVENEKIHRKLIELGVNKSQGYYFDEPRASLEK